MYESYYYDEVCIRLHDPSSISILVILMGPGKLHGIYARISIVIYSYISIILRQIVLLVLELNTTSIFVVLLVFKLRIYWKILNKMDTSPQRFDS